MTTSVPQQHAAEARRRLVDSYLARGERVVGLKISLTSPQARARVGTDRPIWGWLTNTMELGNGAVIEGAGDRSRRAEAELVFVLGRDLVGPGLTGRDVLAATQAVCPGIELPAHRGGSATPSATDLIARNALANQFVVGDPVSHWHHLDLALLRVVVEVNGEPAHSGCAADTHSHPADAIASVANDLARQEGGALRAGQLVFTGAITPPVTVTPAMTIDTDFAHLGRVGVSMARQLNSQVST